ncbi:MAG TPA: type I restriction endonuclease subunit R [Acidimicrobiia bacterium]|nr:type I restriction endonuclease subunit R [Acidimicrobiia bacterium]
MSLSSEAAAVQHPMVRYATDMGWDYLSPEEAVRLRRGEASPILWEVLIDQLQRLNPETVDLDRAEQVAKGLVQVKPTIEGNLDAWEYLRGLKTVFVPAESRERNIALLDVDQPDRNTFHVTPELSFTNGTKTVRLDVVFLVNGIPVIVVEAKAATKQQGMSEAFDQVVRYHRYAPELMAITQLHALSQLVHFYYGATWSLSAKALLNWRDETAGNYEELCKTFIHPERVLRVLTDFILFTRQDDELKKVVLRPHQMRAVDKVVERAADPNQRRGLVWHTQGSGKTFTMITVAEKLIRTLMFENPTVLMLVDRNELEAQLFSNLEAVGFGHVEVADSKSHLRELLASDYRGLLVSTIHKFEDMPSDLVTRENVFVLIDEAHRTTTGDLGNFLMGAIPNATYLGFTGTPIDKTAYGKGTFKVFGGDDPNGYLDKYSIRQSIDDGATVPLHYTLAPNELRVEKEILETEFLALAESEGVADVVELDRVLKGAVTLRNMLKNPDRVRKVAAHIANHYSHTIEPMGYKAFLVAVDREACALYKGELDKHLPTEWSTVVYSPFYNDPPELARWHLSDDQEQAVRKAFRKPDESPKILIVTEKLLTGFDAPILYGMYLDKPMRDHVLLQAIARVNRPYEDDEGRRKQNGLIVDYVGVFENLEKALAFDSEDVAGIVEDLEVLRVRFEQLIGQARAEYLEIGEGLRGDKKVEAVIEAFREPEVRDVFYGFYREVEELYEILSPDPFLRPYINDFGRLSETYQLLRATFEPHLPVGKSFLRKTAELVQEMTHTGSILDPTDVYVLDEGVLDVLTDADKPDTVKVFNLVKVLEQQAREMGAQQPYLIPIGERAEQIAEAFQQRLIDAQRALDELTALLDEARLAEKDRQESGMSMEGFSVAWLLNREGVKGALDVGRKMEAAFADNPHWRASHPQQAEVRKALYRELLQGLEVPEAAELVGRIIDVLKRSEV